MAMPAQPEPPRLLIGLPSWLLAQLAVQGHRLVGDALAARGLRRHHFSVLAALREQGAVSQAELGRRLGLDRSDIHGVLALLSSERLVTRVRDGMDRRRNLVALTGEGEEALEQLTDGVLAAQAALLEPLKDDEREPFVAMLERLHRHHLARQAAPGARDGVPQSSETPPRRARPDSGSRGQADGARGRY